MKISTTGRFLALGLGLAGTNTLAILLAVGYGFAPAYAGPAAQILFMLYFAAFWLSFSLAAAMEIYHLHLTGQLRANRKTGRLLALGPAGCFSSPVPRLSFH